MKLRIAISILLLLMLATITGCAYLTPPIHNIAGAKTEVSKDEHASKIIYIRIKTPTTQPKESKDEDTSTDNDLDPRRRIGVRFRNGGRGK
ncbi:MAG: hypothetical protein KAV00_06910 [Phycisphaerae bacterium]|nr:hypothetical protein [Phycisphaerae bacterium]